VKQRVLIAEKGTVVNFNIAKKILDTLKMNSHSIGQVCRVSDKPRASLADRSIASRMILQINVQTGESITYQVMRERSVKCARFLRLQNIGPGDIITICPSKTMDFYVPFLAGLFVGAIVNTWDVRCKRKFRSSSG